MAKKARPKNWIEIINMGDWRMNLHVGSMVFMGGLYERRSGIMRAAKQVRAATGWPMVEK